MNTSRSREGTRAVSVLRARADGGGVDGEKCTDLGLDRQVLVTFGRRERRLMLRIPALAPEYVMAVFIWIRS